MKNKMKNKKGFTLMEMLIVVAIMVVLVAVAVPTFTSQVNNAKKAADDANIRAARSVAATTYLVNGTAITNNYFDAEKGTISSTKPTKAYGQGVTTNSLHADSTGCVLKVNVDANGNITLNWEKVTAE